jgi:uncharacterized protein
MKQVKRLFKTLALVSTLVFFLSAPCLGKDVFLTMGGGTEGGTYELVAGAISGIIENSIPEAKVTVIPGGSTANPNFIGKGRAQMGISTSATIYDAYEGNAPFKKPIKNLRAITGLFPQAWQFIVLKSSGIEKISDLVKFHYCPAKPGQVSYFHSRTLTEMTGIPFKDFKKQGGKVSPMGFGEVRRQMKDKIVQATSWTTSIPQAGFEDVATARKIRMIGVDPDMLKKYLQKYPSYIPYTIPAGSYSFQPDPVNTVGTTCCFFISAEVSEELGYKITKALMTNLDKLQITFVGIKKYLTLESASAGFKLPLHPGAIKYYKEKGVLK